jgi:(p)ppGpp synthase/HD superfamily hydrolase
MEVLLAQTNLQLYSQMRSAGFTPADIQRMQKDYETACYLFAPKCRSTGRPFLCHAVGTASAALIEGAPLLDVRAALLHAAYKHGRFPDHKRRRTQAHEDWLTDRSGSELAALIGDFAGFTFTPDAVNEYLALESAPNDKDFRLIRLKLANDVDDSHAFGAALGHKKRYADLEWLENREALSRKLGLPFFTEAFALAMKNLNDAAWLDTDTVFANQGYIRSLSMQFWGTRSGRGYL